LTKICLDLNRGSLIEFIDYCSAFLEDQDFQKVFKLSRSFLKDQNKQSVSCDDWLVESLYFLYNDGAEKF
jgi:hypothetical protein